MIHYMKKYDKIICELISIFTCWLMLYNEEKLAFDDGQGIMCINLRHCLYDC